MKKLRVVVGGQYGSEAKGHVTKRLVAYAAENEGTPQVIRVAGPNAGHTTYDATGRAWALRQVPVGAVHPGPAVLGVAAGSEVDPPVLLAELDSLKEAGLLADKMVWVSGAATVITDAHKEDENTPTYMVDPKQGLAEDKGSLVTRIGSTGKGIGAARADRLMRRAQRVADNVELVGALADRGYPMADVYHAPGRNHPGPTIIEGTQGYALGLHGKHYPQCTSSDCRAIDFMAMAGVHPWEFEDTEVWVTARMYPIRVAGNSGPMYEETTWEALGLPPEYTTVTKKMRRVGRPDWGLVAAAVRANGGPARNVHLALTMVDQMFPWTKDLTLNGINLMKGGEAIEAMDNYFLKIQRTAKAPISLMTTGPDTASFVNYPAGVKVS